MALEREFLKKISNDVITIQNTAFIGEDKEAILELISKKELTHHEQDLLCCILSGLVYEYTMDIFTFKFEDYEIHKTGNGLVYGLFHIDDRVYVVFKGSSTFDDFLTDINLILFKTKEFPGKVHLGFSQLLLHKNLYKLIFQKMEIFALKNHCTKIYITGHSLGGALSNLFYYLCIKNKKLGSFHFENITLGSPRVGDSMFSSSIKGERVVNGNDVITMLPFPIFYRHCDEKISINPKRGFPSIVDHDICNYYKHMKKITESDNS